MIDLRETILAQYANSPALTGIIARFNAAADPRTLIESFYQNVWNPETATGWGLDVWGRIVGVGRVQKVPENGFIGFDEAVDGTGTDLPFNDGILYTGQTITGNATLTDDAYRRLIFAKAAANISNGSIADINRILMLIFGGNGRVIYLSEGATASEYFGFNEARSASYEPQSLDHGIFCSPNSLTGGDGSMTICHNWPLSPLDVTLIQRSGALPRTVGIRILYQQVSLT